jgi:hypothetical protein
MLPATADLLEVLYTLAAVLGMIGALGASGYAARDWRAHRRYPDADRTEQRRLRLVTSTVLTNRLISVITQTGIVLLGLRAMSLPPNPASTDAGTRLAGLILLTISVVASAAALLDFVRRYQFSRLDRPDPPKEDT